MAKDGNLSGEGVLGVLHASYSEEGGALVETGVGNAIVGHYLSQLNLSEKAVVFATSASPYEINNLTTENTGEAEIDFRTSLAGLPAPNREMLVDMCSSSGPRGSSRSCRSRCGTC